MPIYEYRCATCGYQNEYLQKVSDPLLTECPDCRKPTFNKLVSAAGFQLKGNGWYATDFKNKGAGKSQTDKESGNKTEASEPNKDDTKADPACGAGACPACT